MTTTINALNNEFAVATGANVGSGGGASTMDGVPGDHSGLVITSNAGDTSPGIFSLGDLYDISFDTAGGTTTTLDDAQIVRSDYLPDYDAWAVVFEGTDAGGNTVQVVWSPGFDLDAWRSAVLDNGDTPQFYNTDQDSGTTYQTVCFAAQTRIATARGRVAAGALRPGDLLETLDAGPQPLVWAARRSVPGWGRFAPVEFAPGAIGNENPLRLSQQHRVLHRSSQAELLFGASEVLLPAKALVDGDRVRFAPVARVTYVHLLLSGHHLIFAEGAACESLFLGDMALATIGGGDRSEAADLFADRLVRPTGRMTAARMMLTFREARLLSRAAGVARARTFSMQTVS